MFRDIQMNIEKIIDLQHYPIHHPDSAEYFEIVNTVNSGLAEDGCVVLPNFLSVDGLEALLNESEERKSQAYYADSKLCNVYLAKGIALPIVLLVVWMGVRGVRKHVTRRSYSKKDEKKRQESDG